MKKINLIIVILLTLIACDSSVKDSKEAEGRITYFKDGRTGLCFAQVTSHTHSGYIVTSIATVDCEKVEKYLDK